MKKFMLTCAVASLVALTGCQTLNSVTGTGTKQTVGAGTGAVLGGVLGSKVGDGSGQLWATGAGALIGMFLGSEVGKSLDKADRAYMSQANVRAQDAPIGEPISWSNPESGNHGQVVPTHQGYSASGKYCRQFQQTIYIDGLQETANGTACRDASGAWQIVDQS